MLLGQKMVENVYLIWLVSYFIPFGLGIWELYFFQEREVLRLILIHILLLISIFLSFYFAFESDLEIDFLRLDKYFYVFLGGLGISLFLIGVRGLGYALSSIIQELSILMIAFILLGIVPFWGVLGMVALPYALAHEIKKGMKVAWVMILIWGMASIYLFYFMETIWLSIAFHLIGGSLFIKKGFILNN